MLLKLSAFCFIPITIRNEKTVSQSSSEKNSIHTRKFIPSGSSFTITFVINSSAVSVITARISPHKTEADKLI